MKQTADYKFQVSIIIAVLESYKIVRRQIRHFRSMNLSDSVEIIFLDDGSDPSIMRSNNGLKNFNIYPTGDTRPWTQGCARNLGAKIAEGKYLFFTDIDHILPREAIDAVLNFNGDKMIFTRTIAVLGIKGNIIQDPKTLFKFGLPEEHYKKRGLERVHHTNTFAIKETLFKMLGGYPAKHCGHKRGTIDDRIFFNRYKKAVAAGKCESAVWGPGIYTYPGLPEDKLKLFHNLTRGE